MFRVGKINIFFEMVKGTYIFFFKNHFCHKLVKIKATSLVLHDYPLFLSLSLSLTTKLLLLQT